MIAWIHPELGNGEWKLHYEILHDLQGHHDQIVQLSGNNVIK